MERKLSLEQRTERLMQRSPHHQSRSSRYWPRAIETSAASHQDQRRLLPLPCHLPDPGEAVEPTPLLALLGTCVWPRG
ncbi:uncharacterized protein LOC141726660 isoform X5 [Zonotrichia albicollis]|uniref:uncharacterized protein LOC141726660 isoform X5 n=1 Tax=Zonotrichia albicollis TaxID=44394 RepID=UPI003D80FDE5